MSGVRLFTSRRMELRSEETYGDELEMMRCTAHERSLSGACSVLGVGNMALFFPPSGEVKLPYRYSTNRRSRQRTAFLLFFSFHRT